MKIKWEAKDIRGGRRVIKPGTDERWIIGYTPAKQGPGNHFAMISLIDGMITKTKTREKMAKDLSEEGYVPIEVANLPYYKEKTVLEEANEKRSLKLEKDFYEKERERAKTLPPSEVCQACNLPFYNGECVCCLSIKSKYVN